MSGALSSRARARRGLALFLGLVTVASLVVEGAILRDGRPLESQPGKVLLLMWTPAAASIACRLVLREGIRDVSFRLGGVHGLRNMLLAWLYPAVAAGLAYGLAWATGLAELARPESVPWTPQDAGVARAFAGSLAFWATAGTGISMLTAFGEELGWRGYMTTRLVDAGVPRPLLVGGVVWGLWHVPLILSGQYASGPSPVLSAACFMGSIVAAGYLEGRLRLDSGSVWPAAMFHAAHNAIVQGTFDAFVRGGGSSHTTNPWVGESGVVVVIVDVVLIALILRAPMRLRRNPRDEGTPLRGWSL